MDNLEVIQVAVRAIGGKWKIMILAKLDDGPLRFSELRRNLPTISQQSLTTQLRELERDGILTREMHAETPSRVEYTLSDRGRKISPLLPHLLEWGNEVVARRDAAQSLADAATL